MHRKWWSAPRIPEVETKFSGAAELASLKQYPQGAAPPRVPQGHLNYPAKFSHNLGHSFLTRIFETTRFRHAELRQL